MKNSGRCNFKKYRDIKDGDKYITLDISLNFGSLDNMKITSLEPKYYLVISGKGLINYLGLKTIRRPKKNKKARYAITNVSLKDIYRIIKEFEKLPYEGYIRKRSKHVLTNNYFYLTGQLAKCMKRFNYNVGPVRMQMTTTKNIPSDDMITQKIPNSQVRYLEKSKSKGINTEENLSHVCSTQERKSKIFIVNAFSLDEIKSKRVHISTNKTKQNMR